MPPYLFFSNVNTNSVIIADVKFKQKMMNIRIKFIRTANTNENVPVDILFRKSITVSNIINVSELLDILPVLLITTPTRDIK
jgi:hypothetical protein